VLARKEVLAGFRQVRTVPIQDRIGHAICTMAVWADGAAVGGRKRRGGGLSVAAHSSRHTLCLDAYRAGTDRVRLRPRDRSRPRGGRVPPARQVAFI